MYRGGPCAKKMIATNISPKYVSLITVMEKFAYQKLQQHGTIYREIKHATWSWGWISNSLYYCKYEVSSWEQTALVSVPGVYCLTNIGLLLFPLIPFPPVLPSLEICFQGLGGYMKAALWIWSLMSSSSLNGNVPLRLTYMMTPTDHMSSERL